MKKILAIVLLFISGSLCFISYKAATKEIIVFNGSHMYSYKAFTYEKSKPSQADQEISTALDSYNDIYSNDQQKAAREEQKKKEKELKNKIESEVSKYKGYTFFSAGGALLCIVFSLAILFNKKQPKVESLNDDTNSA
jgi:predicted lipase